jgi:hypothetical protein
MAGAWPIFRLIRLAFKDQSIESNPIPRIGRRRNLSTRLSRTRTPNALIPAARSRFKIREDQRATQKVRLVSLSYEFAISGETSRRLFRSTDRIPAKAEDVFEFRAKANSTDPG